MSDTPWLTICHEVARCHEVGTEIVAVLSAFPPRQGLAGPVSAPDFAGLEALLPGLRANLLDRLETHLAQEVDAPQAAMFTRRFAAVLQVLDQLALADIAGRLLRVGMVLRLDEMMAAAPTALRVRALIDFYYSQAGILHHATPRGQSRPPTLLELAKKTPWTKVERGLYRRTIDGMTRKGPVHISALRFDRGRFRFSARDLRPDIGAGLAFQESVAAAGAVAGFSGGYFLYSEPNIAPPATRFDPVGLVISDGRVLQPPTYARPCFAQDAKGHCHVLPTSMKGIGVQFPDGPVVRLGAVNNSGRMALLPVAFNRAFKTAVPHHEGPLLTLVGNHLSRIQFGGSATIPVGAIVISLPPHSDWNRLAESLAVGSSVSYDLPRQPHAADLLDAIAGGPTLVDRGHSYSEAILAGEEFINDAEPMTFSTDETQDQNLLPRLAIGITATFDVIVLAVDGRNFDRALGLTLGQTASLMRALGCTSAINMDGGSSKRLVLHGEALDLPTTDIIAGDTAGESVRPVYNGFLVFSR